MIDFSHKSHSQALITPLIHYFMSSPHPTLSGQFLSDQDSFPQQCETILELFKQSDEIVQAGRNTLKKSDI